MTTQRRVTRPKTRAVDAMPVATFRDWILRQVDRSDLIGTLARDLIAETQRLGREPAALRYHADLLWHCEHAPAELKLSREVGREAWRQWLEFLVGQDTPSDDAT
jgi:hypothetical protein